MCYNGLGAMAVLGMKKRVLWQIVKAIGKYDNGPRVKDVLSSCLVVGLYQRA